jgi:2-polyprenyl-6-methoxyphenol hydroxylase-like FAD-dependent oxidoreductase
VCFRSLTRRVVCCSYEETADGVTVRFSSRGGGETAYSARVLIGADGGFSGVRRQCLDDGLPKNPVSAPKS